MRLSLPSPPTRRGRIAKPKDWLLKVTCMMSTITTGLRTFHHRREAGAASGVAATPTPLTITATKTITTITDMTTTTTEAATTTRTTAMTTTRGPAEDEGAESAAAPVRPGAVATSRHGAGWASPRGEALEQAAEQGNGAEGGPDLSQRILT